MPQITIKRSIEINAPAEKVFSAINHFDHWTKWSPWLILEPDGKNTVSEDGKYNEWEGRRLGAGNMRITGEKANESVQIDLNFIKPWKSSSKVSFDLKEKDGLTTVTWSMNNKLPFLFFFMKKMMEIYVGMDFDRGLSLMKDYVEDGEAHCKMIFIGREQFSEVNYLGIRTNCTKDTMAKKMQEDIPGVLALIEKEGLEIKGDLFTQYEKWDMKHDRITYICGVPVASVPKAIPSGFIIGKIPDTPAYSIEMTGPYRHLGSAWSALYSMQRAKDFKANKKIHPFEVYRNKPGDVPETELITKVYFPII